MINSSVGVVYGRSDASRVQMKVGQRTANVSNTWHRGEHVNYLPFLANLDEPRAALDAVLSGWTPPEAFIDKETRITAFGSCFAANISNHLAERNYNILTAKSDDAEKQAYIILFGEGMVNSYAILQQFEWALLNKAPTVELWHGYKAEEFGYNEDVRIQTRQIFDQTDLFIITFGLSEVWYDTVTGEVFWRAVPDRHYDASRHKFKVVTPEENSRNIEAIRRLIREHYPNSRIIFTMSPIPLFATFRNVSCFTANSVSKASLRFAIDDVLRQANDPGLFYWPSYEMVLELFQHRWKADRRHVRKEILDFIMVAFESVYCKTAVSESDLFSAFLEAKAVDGSIPTVYRLACEQGNKGELEAAIGSLVRRERIEQARFLLDVFALKHPEEHQFVDQMRNEHKAAFDSEFTM